VDHHQRSFSKKRFGFRGNFRIHGENMNIFCKVVCAFLLLACAAGISSAQSSRDESRLSPAAEGGTELPLKKISLFSSGVGYFEHSGRTSVPLQILLFFNAQAVNDALKSLVINDPAPNAPLVRYASAGSLEAILKSLPVDLSGKIETGKILDSRKGAELEVYAPTLVTGRILGVETRVSAGGRPGENAPEQYLALFTPQGIRTIALRDISSFAFKDETINAGIGRALDLLMTGDREMKELAVSLPGTGDRVVSLSYVIPAPVWKVSYRLDLSGEKPFLQGWAVIDNGSDTDWRGVELSLVTGKPVSFIQNLYAPYMTARPVLPLSLPGLAEGRTYEPGWAGVGFNAEGGAAAEESPAPAYKDMSNVYGADADLDMRKTAPRASASGLAERSVQTAAGNAAGDQFEFTFTNPVSLERRRSVMLPLVEGPVQAEKALVFSGGRMANGTSINPAVSAELTNSSGMKLPAGPITVYDGGTYAGDALIGFFPENEKRIISYGEDLSVSGSAASSGVRVVSSVSVSQGVMTINRRQSYERTYTLRNASAEKKRIIIEHPVSQGTTLTEPADYDERTPDLYRFTRTLDALGEMSFTVKEDKPLSERIVLSQIRGEAFLSYASSQEIPGSVRAALNRAAELRRLADADAAARQELEDQRDRLVSDQDRIRRNLEAAGSESSQGQEYLKRMAAMDAGIDALNTRIEEAAQKSAASRKEAEDYLGSLNIP
jgi:hypothetical protein